MATMNFERIRDKRRKKKIIDDKPYHH